MIALYKKGNTHVVKGIECEIVRVENHKKDVFLNMGYVGTVEELLPKKGRPKKEVTEATDEPTEG